MLRPGTPSAYSQNGNTVAESDNPKLDSQDEVTNRYAIEQQAQNWAASIKQWKRTRYRSIIELVDSARLSRPQNWTYLARMTA